MRSPLLLLLDCAAVAVAGALTSSALSHPPEPSPPTVTLMATVALCQAVGGWLTGVYRGRFAVGRSEEFNALGLPAALVAIATSVVGAMAGMSIAMSAFLGLSTVCLSIAFLLAPRYGWRTIARRKRSSSPQRRTLIVGAGDTARDLIDALRRDLSSELTPVALLDDDPHKSARTVRGIPVRGTLNDVAVIAKRVRAESVVVAIPSLGSARREAIETAAAEAGLDFRYVPALPELLHPTFEKSLAGLNSGLTSMLLGREEVGIDRREVSSYVRDAVVLITGAGGSIGSELTRQLATYGPAQLWLIDHDESALHGVLLDLARLSPDITVNPVVASIRDRERVHEVFAQAKPTVVFHAAALKHVPMLEAHPEEGIKTNVMGTLNVLSAASHAGVRRFVNISTDKAADPINTLGFTKRIAERLTAHHANAPGVTYLSVRFGNVLGSRGSVLPTFLAQIESGGPVTITDPDMTRYFMTISEAVTLVLLGAAIGQNGRVLVLDMGLPVRIIDLASELIRRSGRKIPLVVTGLRPGEKLTETLFSGSEAAAVRVHAAILAASVPPIEPAMVARLGVADLEGLAVGAEEAAPAHRRAGLLRDGVRPAMPANGKTPAVALGSLSAMTPEKGAIAWPDPRRAQIQPRRGLILRFTKRAIDVTVAASLLILTAPIMALVALLIRLRLGRPVFFRQMRPGLRGAPFELVKFRSLQERYDETGALLPFEQRLTRFGAMLRSTSLDELPELLNVLRGDMSLVGPRPLLMDYLHRYDDRQAVRHLVKPGLTGLAQVQGRESLSWEEKFALDVEYVQSASLSGDLRILAATLRVMLARQHVTPEGQATSSYFMGSDNSVRINEPIANPVPLSVARVPALEPAMS